MFSSTSVLALPAYLFIFLHPVGDTARPSPFRPPSSNSKTYHGIISLLLVPSCSSSTFGSLFIVWFVFPDSAGVLVVFLACRRTGGCVVCDEIRCCCRYVHAIVTFRREFWVFVACESMRWLFALSGLIAWYCCFGVFIISRMRDEEDVCGYVVRSVPTLLRCISGEPYYLSWFCDSKVFWTPLGIYCDDSFSEIFCLFLFCGESEYIHRSSTL